MTPLCVSSLLQACVIQIRNRQLLIGITVTRIIRVSSDAGTEIRVNSLLSNELDNPSWKRFERSTTNEFEYFSGVGRDPDFQITGDFEEIRAIGDFNGDDKEDFVVDVNATESVILYGGLSESIEISATLARDSRLGPVLQRPQLEEGRRPLLFPRGRAI